MGLNQTRMSVECFESTINLFYMHLSMVVHMAVQLQKHHQIQYIDMGVANNVFQLNFPNQSHSLLEINSSYCQRM